MFPPLPPSAAKPRPSALPPFDAATGAAVRRWRGAFAVVLLAHVAAAWLLFGDLPIGASWREADTQAMARNLVADGFDLLHPRIDWRGKTSGEVECEFPLYQGLLAAMLGLLGDVEWPGRLLSLLATATAAWALFELLLRRCGGPAAWLGALVFLGSAQAAFLGTRVMPDALSLALSLLGLLATTEWLAAGRPRLLVAAAAATLAGVLAKPTAAPILLVQAAWTLLLAPRRLRTAAPWLAAGAVALTVAAWMLHARSVGLATGLSFGVTFGDTKLPDLDHLLRPSVWWRLATSTLEYGASWPGVLGGALLLLRRQFDRFDAALLGAVVAGLVVSLRYSHDSQLGPQYHVHSAVVGAWLLARGWSSRWGAAVFGGAAATLLSLAIVHLQHERTVRKALAASAHVATAAALQQVAAVDDLVAIRGPKPAYDAFWRRRNNYEEPVLLYLSRRRGFVLPADGADANGLAAVAAAGARWYVDPAPGGTTPDGLSWLAAHAELVAVIDGASIHALRR